ncbi:basic proline-rich protein-like [Vulpes lagopus]|uniref:basic proline-rich protein-like n=1 Tax=Vulpes lagopus TaxID=494514 RepID=UPI001BC904E2|nr:basic proline-rich protein-like [Vulpes lagopus]
MVLLCICTPAPRLPPFLELAFLHSMTRKLRTTRLVAMAIQLEQQLMQHFLKCQTDCWCYIPLPLASTVTSKKSIINPFRVQRFKYGMGPSKHEFAPSSSPPPDFDLDTSPPTAAGRARAKALWPPGQAEPPSRPHSPGPRAPAGSPAPGQAASRVTCPLLRPAAPGTRLRASLVLGKRQKLTVPRVPSRQQPGPREAAQGALEGPPQDTGTAGPEASSRDGSPSPATACLGLRGLQRRHGGGPALGEAPQPEIQVPTTQTPQDPGTRDPGSPRARSPRSRVPEIQVPTTQGPRDPGPQDPGPHDPGSPRSRVPAIQGPRNPRSPRSRVPVIQAPQDPGPRRSRLPEIQGPQDPGSPRPEVPKIQGPRDPDPCDPRSLPSWVSGSVERVRPPPQAAREASTSFAFSGLRAPVAKEIKASFLMFASDPRRRRVTGQGSGCLAVERPEMLPPSVSRPRPPGSSRAAPGSTRAAPGQLQGSSRAAPGQLQGSTRAAPGQLQGSTRAAPGQLQGSSRAAPGQLQAAPGRNPGSAVRTSQRQPRHRRMLSIPDVSCLHQAPSDSYTVAPGCLRGGPMLAHGSNPATPPPPRYCRSKPGASPVLLGGQGREAHADPPVLREAALGPPPAGQPRPRGADVCAAAPPPPEALGLETPVPEIMEYTLLFQNN